MLFSLGTFGVCLTAFILLRRSEERGRGWKIANALSLIVLIVMPLLSAAGLVVLYRVTRADIGYSPAPPDAFVLDVPYVQQTTKTDCMPACVSMILQYGHIEFDGALMSEKIATGPVPGSHLSRVHRYLEERNVAHVLFYPTSVEEIMAFVRQGFPVLVAQELGRQEQRAAHAVVVVGVTAAGDAVVVHDPYFGEGVTLPLDTFDRRSLRGGGWTRVALVVGVEEETLPEGLHAAYANIAGPFEEARLVHEINGDPERAIDLLQNTVRLAQDFVPAYLWLGSCLAQADRHQEAIAAYQKALQVDESYFWGIARLRLAGCQLTLGEYDKAKLNLQKFILIEPAGSPDDLQLAQEALAYIEEVQSGE